MLCKTAVPLAATLRPSFGPTVFAAASVPSASLNSLAAWLGKRVSVKSLSLPGFTGLAPGCAACPSRFDPPNDAPLSRL